MRSEIFTRQAARAVDPPGKGPEWLLGNALVATVRRRRRDLSVLKVIGFSPRHVSMTVAWQASFMALVGVVLGLPLGVAVGRWSWGVVANGAGVVNHPVVPLGMLAAVGAGALFVANLVAAIPGRLAARARPALGLRAE